MPVPRNRNDDAYFAPLNDLKLRPETLLCLGLIHYTDGVTGTRKRLATAAKHVTGFTNATECGFDRRDPGTLTDLLKIHREVASDRVSPSELRQSRVSVRLVELNARADSY